MVLLIKPPPADNPFNLDMALKTEPLELEFIAAMLKEQEFRFIFTRLLWTRHH